MSSEYILQIIYLFLPAGFANMAPVIFKWIPFLNYPVDFNKKFKGNIIFGSHKTYRGFFFGILTAILVTYIQKICYLNTLEYNLIDYSKINIILFGFLVGFGALFGDLIRSFFKRRMNTQPGKPWFPFDQIDWVIGSWLFILIYIDNSLKIIFTAIILSLILHPLVNYIGYLLKFKKNKF